MTYRKVSCISKPSLPTCYSLTQGSEIRPGRIKSYRIRGRILYDQYEYELKLYGTNTRRYEIRPHCIFSGRIHTRSYWYKVVSTRIFIRVKYEYDHFSLNTTSYSYSYRAIQMVITDSVTTDSVQRSPWPGRTYGSPARSSFEDLYPDHTRIHKFLFRALVAWGFLRKYVQI